MALEKQLLSSVYDEGFEAGYEAGLEAARLALLSQAGAAAQTPSGSPIHRDSRQHLLLAAAPQSSEHISQSAHAPAPQPELQSQPQPHAYGHYISSGLYGHSMPASASDAAQSASRAATVSHELSAARAQPSYAGQAAYGLPPAYTYTGAYMPALKELLGASAYAQANERLRKRMEVDGHPGAYAAPPAQGLSLAPNQTMRVLEGTGGNAPSPASMVIRSKVQFKQDSAPLICCAALQSHRAAHRALQRRRWSGATQAKH